MQYIKKDECEEYNIEATLSKDDLHDLKKEIEDIIKEDEPKKERPIDRALTKIDSMLDKKYDNDYYETMNDILDIIKKEASL